MKKFIKRILFQDLRPTQYVSMRHMHVNSKRLVFLYSSNDKLDISERHWVLCQTPFTVGVWFQEDEIQHPENCSLTISAGTLTCATIQLLKKDQLKIDSGILVLYTVIGASCRQLSFVHRTLLFLYFYRTRKNPLPFSVLKQFCALYSYPRKVIVVCYEDESCYNFFPMDFQGCIPHGKTFLLGLRHSNVTLLKMLEKRKVVVCDVDIVHEEHIYFLGKHHSTHPPPISELPFQIIKSELYNFSLPGFISAYNELHIRKNIDLGSHMLLVCEIVHQQLIKETRSKLHHVHFIQFLHEQKVKN